MKVGRREKVAEILEREGIVYLSELSRIFPEVSVMTLRRDLDYFEKSGAVVRIHGGAQKTTAGREPYYSLRAVKNKTAKEFIAGKCLEFIKEGRSVYIDCGTTAMEIAKIIPDMRLSVITSGPNIAIELSSRRGINVISLGGQLNYDNLSISGRLAENMTEQFNIDTAFIVAAGYTAAGGFSCGSFDECELKRKVIERADKKIILMDGSKFGINLMHTFAQPSDADVFITDKAPPSEMSNAIKNGGNQIIYK